MYQKSISYMVYVRFVYEITSNGNLSSIMSIESIPKYILTYP